MYESVESKFYIQGIFISMYDFIITGFVLNSFLLHIGFKEFELGIYSAFVYLGLVFTVFGAYASKNVSNKRLFYTKHYLITVFAFALFMVTPFIFTGTILYIMVIGMMFIAHASANFAWSVLIPYMHDVVSSKRWDKFYGKRLSIMNLAGLSVIVWGKFLNGKGLSAYTIVFIFAFINLISMIILMHYIPDNEQIITTKEKKEKSEHGNIIKLLISNEGYKFVFIYSSMTSLFMGLFYPLRYRYIIDYLEIDLARLSIYEVIGIILTIIAFWIWGRYSEKKNYLVIILILGIIKGIEPLLWMIAGRNEVFLYPIYILFGANEASGIIGAGLWMTTLNYLLSISDAKNKTMIFNYNFMIKGCAFIIASIAGGYMAKRLYATEIKFPLISNNLEAVMAFSLILSILSVIYIITGYRRLIKNMVYSWGSLG